jgi:hypothetical protein
MKYIYEQEILDGIIKHCEDNKIAIDKTSFSNATINVYEASNGFALNNGIYIPDSFEPYIKDSIRFSENKKVMEVIKGCVFDLIDNEGYDLPFDFILLIYGNETYTYII